MWFPVELLNTLDVSKMTEINTADLTEGRWPERKFIYQFTTSFKLRAAQPVVLP